MRVLRLAAILTALALAGSLARYVFTRDRRYLGYCRRILQFALVFAAVFLTVYLLERRVLAA